MQSHSQVTRKTPHAAKSALGLAILFAFFLVVIAPWKPPSDAGADGRVAEIVTEHVEQGDVDTSGEYRHAGMDRYYAGMLEDAAARIEAGDYCEAVRLYVRISGDGIRRGATKAQVAEADYQVSRHVRRNGVPTCLGLQPGEPVEIHYEALYEAAIYGDHPEASLKLGQDVLSFEDVRQYLPYPIFEEEAVSLIEQAARAEIVGAMHIVSNWVRNGLRGQLQSESRADEILADIVRILRERADAGDAEAAVDLARRMAAGEGTPRDVAGAVAMMERWAADGHLEAMDKLVSWYSGRDKRLPELFDRGRALHWKVERTSRMGTASEEADLADMLVEWNSDPARSRLGDLVAAHALFNLASTGERSFGADRKRDEVAQQMSEDQIGAAMALAERCATDGVRPCLSGILFEAAGPNEAQGAARDNNRASREASAASDPGAGVFVAPPVAAEELVTPTRGSALREDLLDAARPFAVYATERDVLFVVDTLRTDGRWAYLEARPVNTDGTPIDWSATPLAKARSGGAQAETLSAVMLRAGPEWVVMSWGIGGLPSGPSDPKKLYDLSDALFSPS